MNIKKVLKNLVFYGSVYYTAITVAFILVAMMISESDSVKIIDTDRFLLILLFSFMMSLGSTLLQIDRIPRVAAVCLHAACYILGFFVFILLCGGQFAATVIATAVFALFYLIVTIIVNQLRKRTQKKDKAPQIISPTKKDKNNKKEYKNQFSI